MSDADDVSQLDELVRALQSPPRVDELAHQQGLVAAMRTSTRRAHHEEPMSMITRSRSVRLGFVAGAAVLSLTGAAAAATGVLSDRRPPLPAPASNGRPFADAATSSTTTAEPDDTTTSTAEPTSTSLDPNATATSALTNDVTAAQDGPTPPPCPADVVNHGDYVSQVAQETPPGPEHGRIVSAAAQSDCGKPSSDDQAETPDVDATVQAVAADQGQGNGNGNGKGRQPGSAKGSGRPSGKGRGG